MAKGDILKNKYDAAKKDFTYIQKSKNVSRKSYKLVAEKFYNIYKDNPGSYLADDSLYLTAKTYHKSYLRFKDKNDLRSALKYYRLVAVNYNSYLSADAYLKSADIYILLKDYASAKFMLQRLINRFPDKKESKLAKTKIKGIDKKNPAFREIEVNPATRQADKEEAKNNNINGKGVWINNIRYFSSNDYTRVVIDLNKKANYNEHWLKANPEFNKPPRLFIDIIDSNISDKIPKEIPIKDGLVKTIRWGNFNKNITRIVLDSDNFKDFSVFSMANPNRIVIDVRGQSGIAGSSGTLALKKDNVNTGTLASVFGLKVKKIVIDAGHGGKDPGATYYSLYEKDIVLDIALELKKLFSKHKELEVILTRDRDIFIPLEERTAIANRNRADIFVSVHINASKNKKVTGTETYVLNVTKDKAAMEVAAFENQVSKKSLSDLQGILKDIMLNSKLEESLILAKNVQDILVPTLKTRNLGVKQAPFYVLVGASMPSILVEANFMSNKSVASQLRTGSYRKKIANSIYKGILQYIKKYNGTS